MLIPSRELAQKALFVCSSGKAYQLYCCCCDAGSVVAMLQLRVLLAVAVELRLGR